MEETSKKFLDIASSNEKSSCDVKELMKKRLTLNILKDAKEIASDDALKENIQKKIDDLILLLL